MALSFACDSQNNFILENGEFKLVRDGAEVAQNVRQRLLSYRGDFFLDRNHGVPYLQQIFTRPVNINDIDGTLRDVVLSTEGVKNLENFELNFDRVNRALSLRLSFVTTYDTVEELTINA